MSVFARGADSERTRTFAAPAPEPMTPALIARLTEAAARAEAEQRLLAEAKEAYEGAPTPANLRRVEDAAASALEREMAFDEVWMEASEAWFRAGRAAPLA